VRLFLNSKRTIDKREPSIFCITIIASISFCSWYYSNKSTSFHSMPRHRFTFRTSFHSGELFI